ncbi:uncharacterized protein LOC107490958 [Arachis duranensis]|uniref:Uncharacterized protein LOC107490958 n=1 Tax=Arachis duranensis TaxID=130453 RepID=A0A6P4DJS3_ARADU|nr:uncharacterized protein LOC107490958 [Arachis duranensis]
MVNKSRVTEDCVKKVALNKGDQRAFVRRDQWRNFVPRGQNFKQGSYVPQQHLGKNSFRRFNNNNNMERGKGKQIQNPPNILTCRRCGAYHSNSPCRARLGVYYYCGRARHLTWNYPERKRQEAERVQQQGRVFTMTADGAERLDTLIKGNCEIGGKILIALFDTGVSHSFISFEKDSELGLKITMLA